MPNIIINFDNPLNEAVQADSKDVAYYADTSQTTFGDGSTVDFADSVVRLGPIVKVDYVNNNIEVDLEPNTVLPSTNDFIFFAKDNRANMTSLLGYYNEVEMTNNSTSKAELYAVGTEIVESSK
jgi:hypothetical protein|tara:strand:- start:72 stop:443 length:372 start_codon:yes stop_codon:yes gene_type:complete